MNRKTLSGKSHNMALIKIKAKTNTLYPSNENIEFGLKNMTVIRSINIIYKYIGIRCPH